ncbi:MAG: TrkA C-terminal domain-containing protein [Haloarculaceae archaeon]
MEDAGRRVEYEPRSVKELLGEMKDTAELLIDLSYSSVLFEDTDLAEEVLELEARMDVLQLQARMTLVMAGRSPEDAEALAPVFGIVGAAEKISDAAGDVAKVVREEVGVLPAFRASLPDAVETLARATVAADSPYAGETLGGLNLETETGVRVVAVRRGEEWVHSPDRDTTLEPGDVVVCRGPDEGVAGVFETLTGDPFEVPAADRGGERPLAVDAGESLPAWPGPDESGAESDTQDRADGHEAGDEALADLDRAVESLVLMKNVSELAVDLAYSSVLFDDADLAEEVRALEVEVDALKSRFEAWTLRAAGSVEDPVALRGLLHVAASTEVISDAAVEISEGVLRGLGTHPVVQAAVEESDEVLVRSVVTREGDLAGETIADLTRSVAGLRVLAIRREGDDGADGRGDVAWELSPSSDATLRPGDHLIAKGTRTSAARLAELA